MVARFKLNSRPRALSPVPFSSAQRTQSPRIRLHLSDTFSSKRQIPTLRSRKFSLFSLFAPKEEISPFVFNHLHTLFHSLQKSETLSPFFSATSTLFAEIPRGRGTPSTRAWHSSLPLGTKLHPIHCLRSLVASRYVFISLHLYFHVSREKPYPQTLSSYGEEIPNRVYTPGVRGSGFRVCFTNPDKRKSYLQTLS